MKRDIIVIKAIITEIAKIIGPVAITQANQIEGLDMSKDGKLKVKGDPEELAEELIKRYEGLIGDVARTIANKALDETDRP